jgi:DNA repair exonuclease SbcCD ATPase subunit
MHDTQHSRVLNAGLIEKLNQLKTNIQELTTKLQNKTNNEEIASLELILKKVQEEALGARASALQAQEAINEINNKDEAVDALVAHSNTIITNLQQAQQQIKTKLNGHLENYETFERAQRAGLAEISSSIENIGTAEHENIMKNLNLSIKKFQEYKAQHREEFFAQHQNLMRRLGELYAEKQLHKLLVLQIWSKSINLRKNKKVKLMNNEFFYQVPLKCKLIKMKIHSSSNMIFSQPLKYTIHIESRILITAWGPFPKTFEFNKDIEPNMKLYFTPSRNTNDGLYVEFIGEAIA